MKLTKYYYPEELLARVRKMKEATGAPMAEIIRRAIDQYLKEKGY